jgi:hypothetical protein
MHRDPHPSTQRSQYDGKDMTRNSYFAKYRKQWENEMHFVVEDYKTNIFNQKGEMATSTRNVSENRRKYS